MAPEFLFYVETLAVGTGKVGTVRSPLLRSPNWDYCPIRDLSLQNANIVDKISSIVQELKQRKELSKMQEMLTCHKKNEDI